MKPRRLTLAKRIRAAIDASGKMQNQIAAEIGVSDAVVSQWASGTRTPQLDNLVALVRACGLEMDVFWGERAKGAA